MERVVLVTDPRQRNPGPIIVDGRIVMFERHRNSGLVVPVTPLLVTKVTKDDERRVERSRRRD